MNTSLKTATSHAALKLGMPLDKVEKIYRSYWLSIKNIIQLMELKKDLDKDSFDNVKTSFNIPSLGKLYTNYDRIKGVKKRFEYLQKIRENDKYKETETPV